MNQTDDPHRIQTLEQLLALFDTPGEASLRKQIDWLHPLYQQLIAASSFVALATSNGAELDVSPRGDPAGFVQVLDERTLLLPERRGNNRLDTLRNLIADPRCALLFLIPGLGETLRVNGRAEISVAPELLERCAMQGKLPKCVLRIHVENVYFQCARAIARSQLWQPASLPAGLPSAGQILAAMGEGSFDGEAYDRALPARQKATLY
ncbi:pyridoxamine 5'-phosphate oxidase family protein [Viridibacterium curvum]|uniref:Pyridoxamine 5'-phosphate oxidase family protein n=2 Tax=Viridibacterium curvum TaxID=1101404 RepID=A0ABP9Q647_9RHOO